MSPLGAHQVAGQASPHAHKTLKAPSGLPQGIPRGGGGAPKGVVGLSRVLSLGVDR
jgi:hypothetical protein